MESVLFLGREKSFSPIHFFKITSYFMNTFMDAREKVLGQVTKQGGQEPLRNSSNNLASTVTFKIFFGLVVIDFHV